MVQRIASVFACLLRGPMAVQRQRSGKTVYETTVLKGDFVTGASQRRCRMRNRLRMLRIYDCSDSGRIVETRWLWGSSS